MKAVSIQELGELINSVAVAFSDTLLYAFTLMATLAIALGIKAIFLRGNDFKL